MLEALSDTPVPIRVMAALLLWRLLLTTGQRIVEKLDPSDRLRLRSVLISPLLRLYDLLLNVVVYPLVLLLGLLKWLAKRCEITARWVYGRVVRQIVARYVQWSKRRASRHLAWARRPFGQDGNRIFPHSRAVRASVQGWYSSMPFEAATYIVKAFVFLLVTINLAAIMAVLMKATVGLWERSGAPAGPGGPGGHLFGSVQDRAHRHDGLDPLLSLVVAFRKLGEAVADKAAPYLAALADPWSRPVEAVTAAMWIAAAGVALLALRVAFAGILRFLPVSPVHAGGPLYLAPSPRFTLIRTLLSLKVGTNRRNRPVVVLVNCLARVGAARQHYRRSVNSGHLTDAPRVHLADVEQIVWSAWRTRHAAIRGVQRAQYKEHAEQVVGALRAVEARQDTAPDTGQVLDEMARMLAKIAERYAQGRVLALLDPEDLTDAPRAANREWLRLVVLGAVVIGAAVGVPVLGLSDAAATQVVGVISLVTVVLLYGSRLAPTDLLDVVRGQSRK
ncbi:hypothetical protein [Streptomyces sp. NPDC048612]|uniref:hypothetical protein n=1 Tax=Streptomyces sp. NPDC048612 TaxID=3365579 RepID=UPI003710D3A1